MNEFKSRNKSINEDLLKNNNGNYKSNINNFRMPGLDHVIGIGSKPTCRKGRDILKQTITLPYENEKHYQMKNAKSIEMINSKYNPITNPIPNYNQNPYINKEIDQALINKIQAKRRKEQDPPFYINQ